ncbi:MAG: hypothetical protein V1649_03995, partial [Patescibacteria group bacterium]
FLVLAFFSATISFAATYRQTGHDFWWRGSDGNYHPIVYFVASGVVSNDKHVLIDNGIHRHPTEKNWIVWDFGGGYYGVLVETSYAAPRYFWWWTNIVLKDSNE